MCVAFWAGKSFVLKDAVSLIDVPLSKVLRLRRCDGSPCRIKIRQRAHKQSDGSDDNKKARRANNSYQFLHTQTALLEHRNIRQEYSTMERVTSPPAVVVKETPLCSVLHLSFKWNQCRCSRRAAAFSARAQTAADVCPNPGARRLLFTTNDFEYLTLRQLLFGYTDFDALPRGCLFHLAAGAL